MSIKRLQFQAALMAAAILLGTVSFAQTSRPSDYPGTVDGLQQYFKDMLTATAANDQQRLLDLCQALILPKPKDWFSTTFGKPLGAKLAERYDTDMANFGEKLAVLFLRLDTPKELKVTVVKVENPGDPQAKLVQTYVIDAMVKPEALYSVNIAKEGTTGAIGLWSCVYVDKQFRLAGKMLTIREDARGTRGAR